MDEDTRAYRPSELSEYMECPRRYMHKYVEELVPLKFGGTPREIGTGVHAGVEALHAGVPVKEAVLAASTAYLEAWREWKGERTNDALEAMADGAEVVKVCVSEYPWAQLPSTEVLEGQEERIVVPMGQGRALSARIDRRIRVNGQMWVHDTKTTGMPLEIVRKAHRVRKQFVAYDVAHELAYGERPQGVIVDYIKKPRIYRKKDRTVTVSGQAFEREPMTFTQEQREEFSRWFHKVADRIEEGHAIMDEAHDIETLTEEAWPQNTGACMSFNRLCSYWDLCSAGSPQAAERLKPVLYTVKPPVEEGEE